MEIAKEMTAALETPLALSVLAEGVRYNPDIRARLCELSGDYFAWSGKHLSRLLFGLTKRGLAAGRWEGRQRKCYSITAKGQKALASLREQWRAAQAILARAGLPGPAS